MMNKNRSFWLGMDRKFFLVEEDMPVLGDHDVLIKPMANSICGSELRTYTTGFMGKRAMDEPCTVGHECSGIITETGKKVSNLHAGQHVVIEPGIYCQHCANCTSGRYNICDDFYFTASNDYHNFGKAKGGHGEGAMRDFLAVPEHMLHVIPDDMDFDVAALAEPTAVAVHAVRRAGDLRGKDVAIFGAGPIGMLVMQCALASGAATVTMIDISAARLKLAMERGASAVIQSGATEIPSYAFDVLFEVTGIATIQNQMVYAAKRGSTLVQVGWPGKDAVIDIYEFNWKELTYNGSIDYAGDFPTAIRWLADGRVDGKAMITHRFKFEEIPEAFELAATKPDECIKAVIIHE